MDKEFYPEIPEGAVFALSVILQNTAEDPEYLEFSPYSVEEIDLFQRFEAVEEEIPNDEDKWSRLERESNTLFKDLTEAKSDFGKGDAAQKMAYFRTATSLLEKIVSIQERTANLKKIHEFREEVLNVLETVMDAGQRTEVLERLQNGL